MQDKFQIVFYENPTPHITEMLIAFLEKFGKQLLDEGVAHVAPLEPISVKDVAHSHKIINQADFCTSIRRAKGNEIRVEPIRLRNVHKGKH